jgi:hypothetical protein
MERDHHGGWDKGVPHEQSADGGLLPPTIYCEDFVPEGIIRDTALKTAEITLLF